MAMVKYTVSYLKGAMDYNLRFQKSDSLLSLIGFYDADWGSSEDLEWYICILFSIIGE